MLLPPDQSYQAPGEHLEDAVCPEVHHVSWCTGGAGAPILPLLPGNNPLPGEQVV